MGGLQGARVTKVLDTLAVCPGGMLQQGVRDAVSQLLSVFAFPQQVPRPAVSRVVSTAFLGSMHACTFGQRRKRGLQDTRLLRKPLELEHQMSRLWALLLRLSSACGAGVSLAIRQAVQQQLEGEGRLSLRVASWIVGRIVMDSEGRSIVMAPARSSSPPFFASRCFSVHHTHCIM